MCRYYREKGETGLLEYAFLAIFTHKHMGLNITGEQQKHYCSKTQNDCFWLNLCVLMLSHALDTNKTLNSDCVNTQMTLMVKPEFLTDVCSPLFMGFY